MRAGEHCFPAPAHIQPSNPQACRATALRRNLNAVVLRGECICRSEARLGQSMRIPFREDYVALHISLVCPQTHDIAVRRSFQHNLRLRSAHRTELCSERICSAPSSSLRARGEQGVLSSVCCAGVLDNPGHIPESPRDRSVRLLPKHAALCPSQERSVLGKPGWSPLALSKGHSHQKLCRTGVLASCRRRALILQTGILRALCACAGGINCKQPAQGQRSEHT